jgi:hypothetical protein
MKRYWKYISTFGLLKGSYEFLITNKPWNVLSEYSQLYLPYINSQIKNLPTTSKSSEMEKLCTLTLSINSNITLMQFKKLAKDNLLTEQQERFLSVLLIALGKGKYLKKLYPLGVHNRKNKPLTEVFTGKYWRPVEFLNLQKGDKFRTYTRKGIIERDEKNNTPFFIADSNAALNETLIPFVEII